MQLGAFYPFSRNHNVIGERPQEPYVWDSVSKTAKTFLNIRYSILNYMYTLVYDSHFNGHLIWYPMFYIWPQDIECSNLNLQFMLGNALMIIPVVEPGIKAIKGYFPISNGNDNKEIWYDFYNHTKINLDNENGKDIEGKYKVIEVSLEKIPVFIRGGSILTLQNPELSVSLTKKNKVKLLISLDKELRAKSKVYFDDDLNETKSYNLIEMSCQMKAKNFLNLYGSYNYYRSGLKLDNIKIIGVPNSILEIWNGSNTTYYEHNPFACNNDLIINIRKLVVESNNKTCKVSNNFKTDYQANSIEILDLDLDLDSGLKFYY